MKICDLDFESTADLNDDIFTVKGGSKPQSFATILLPIVCTMYLLPSGVIECRCE